MKIKKITAIVAFIVFILSSNPAIYAVLQYTVTFSDTTASSSTQTISIANLRDIKNATASNGGKVTYSIDPYDKTKVYVTVAGGTPRTDTAYLSNYVQQYSNPYNIPYSIPYSDFQGYSGVLYQSGPLQQSLIGGEYYPADSITKSSYIGPQESTSFPATMSYNENSYSGILSQYGSYVNEGISRYMSKFTSTYNVTATSTESYVYTNGWRPMGSNGPIYPTTFSYSDADGYSGTLNVASSSWHQISETTKPYNPKNGTYITVTKTYNGYADGTVSKPVYQYTQFYYGVVTRPAVDTRTWAYYQYYAGNVSRNLYSSNVTLNYNKNVYPVVSVANGLDNSVVGPNSVVSPTINVSYENGNNLSCSMYVDSETTPRETKVVSNTTTSQGVAFSSSKLNISALSDGAHTLKFVVTDADNAAVYTQALAYITVSVARPTITADAKATDSSITVNASAKDLHTDSVFYEYFTDSYDSLWTTANSFTFSGLTPNHPYRVYVMAKNAKGNMTSPLTLIVYTKSQVPSLTIDNVKTSSFDVKASDNNPSNTPYQISVSSSSFSGIKYVDSSGNLVDQATWIEMSDNKNITVNGLTPGVKYSVQAKSMNDAKEQSANSSSVGVTTTLNPPAGVTAVANQDKTVTVTWPQVQGASAYQVEIDDNGVKNIVDAGTNTIYIHTNTRPETVYTYRVRANNESGMSNFSDPVTVTTPKDIPDVPENLMAVSNVELKDNLANHFVTLSWDGVKNALNYEILGKDGAWITVPVGTLSYKINGLAPETNYKFGVRADNASGCSDTAYIEVTTKPNPPQAPNDVKYARTQNAITVSWGSVPGADSYKIKVDGVVYDLNSSLSYTHKNLAPCTKHVYQVMGVNKGVEGIWSKEKNIETLPLVPSIPYSTSATSQNNSVTFSWNPVSNSTFYEVAVDGDEDNLKTVTGITYSHVGLLPGTTHSYKIRSVISVNGIDNPEDKEFVKSDWSTPVTITTLKDEPNNNTTTNIYAIVNNDSIMIMWDAISDNADYVIEADGKIIDNGNATSYLHGGLLPGTMHTYRLKSAESDSWIAVVNVSTLPAPPGVPENVVTKAYDDKIQISWDPCESATEYEIEIDNSETPIKVGNITSYTHTGLEPGSRHTYRVRAKNMGATSDYSKVVSDNTVSKEYEVNCKKDGEFNFDITASELLDFNSRTFTITYNPELLDVVDLCDLNIGIDVMTSGEIPGTGISVQYIPGKIVFTVTNPIIAGTSWSGLINSILFKSKADGKVQINYSTK